MSVCWGGFSYESLVVHCRNQRVIAVTKACLQRIHLLCTVRHCSPSTAIAPDNVNVRVFLAGFMIAYRPIHVFEEMGALEDALLKAAMPLMTTFQTICDAFRAAPRGSFQEVPHNLTKNMPTLLFEYLKCFHAWKASPPLGVLHVCVAALRRWFLLISTHTYRALTR
jgi:hypothetical protein